MAYYALYKRLKCRNWKPFDMIGWYSHQLYLEWYNSLSEEDKEYLRKKKERDYEEWKTSLAYMMAFIDSYKAKGYDSYFFL